MLAGRWASGAFAHALMAHTGLDDVETEMPSSMYAAVIRLDREDGGGEEVASGRLRRLRTEQQLLFLRAVRGRAGAQDGAGGAGTAELLDRLDPGGKRAPSL